jgi:DnaJ-class molecular chaperone
LALFGSRVIALSSDRTGDPATSSANQMGASRMSALVILVIIAAAGYFVSLRIHPLKRCRTCRMQGRHFGSVYGYAYRRCRTCGGTGRQDRLGTKIFFGGTNDTGIFPRR